MHRTTGAHDRRLLTAATVLGRRLLLRVMALHGPDVPGPGHVRETEPVEEVVDVGVTQAHRHPVTRRELELHVLVADHVAVSVHEVELARRHRQDLTGDARRIGAGEDVRPVGQHAAVLEDALDLRECLLGHHDRTVPGGAADLEADEHIARQDGAVEGVVVEPGRTGEASERDDDERKGNQKQSREFHSFLRPTPGANRGVGVVGLLQVVVNFISRASSLSAHLTK